MNSDNLIRMANQIGVFFESMPDRAEGLEGIATHIRKFWDPRMRRAFLAMVDADQNGAVSEIVRSAVREHRERMA
ncbi:MAG: formate dehydrogenase subunit delta [Rhodoferax sp.]|jgi:formate dehydrogenase subunit delta|nr:formate dehydrogenase subunit delta [Rhodoferax sp.]